VAAAAALAAMALAAPGSGWAHPAKPPPPPVAPPPVVEPIPPEDEDQYRSHVTAIKPTVPGLEARILGGQDKLEVTWTGRTPLVVEGTEGEPMVRISSAGIEINERSPSAYLSADRYAAVSLPADVDPDAPPRWRRIESPGPISWYEHRAQWMEPSRPGIVGDGSRGLTIFHWRVPARLGDRRVVIRGGLDWIPDPSAVRDERSDTASPLLSAGILTAALALGAGVGVLIRRRVAPTVA
jgi:hypothetical protein